MEINKINKTKQYVLSISITLLLSVICFFLREYLDYRIVALFLFLAVSIFAVLFDVIPVVIAAFLSAFILNVFFIEPVFHYKIDNSENTLLFIIYLSIALVSAILTDRIRKQRKKLLDKEKKEETLQLYESLLNSLSHELRIPITTIIGSVDTLKDNYAVLSESNKEELLDEIQNAGLRLNGQVENLLNMSRLESSSVQLHKDWTDMNELVYLGINRIKAFQTHIILFSPDENLPLFKIDFGLMEHILNGLLQNAVKYTPAGSTITIVVKEKNENLFLSVADNGNGFPEESIDRIFEKFYRLPNSPTGGTGLGLSIVKGFVEAHKGSITVENNQEGGATFCISIPAETSYLKNLKNE